MKDLARRGSRNGTQDETSLAQPFTPNYVTPVLNDETENRSGDYLRRYWEIIRRNLWMVVGITIFATLAVTVYETHQPDVYEAQARIEIIRDNVVPGLNGTPNVSGGSSEDSVYFNTQLQILTGSALLRRVAKMLDLEHNDAFLHPRQTSKDSSWQRFLRLVNLGKKVEGSPAKNAVLPASAVVAVHDDWDDAARFEPYVNALNKGLSVEPRKETRTEIKETRLIDINFNHSDPEITARVVNAVADAAAYMNLERKSEKSAIAAEFLKKRIADLQSQIRHDEEQLLTYAAENQILSLDSSQNTVVDRLAGLNRELLEAENERVKASAAYQAALAPDAAESMAADVTNQPNGEESKLAELRQRRAQLLVENTEEWPEVKEIDKQIVEVENQIKDRRASTAANIRKTLETHYRQAAAREQALRTAFNEQRNLTISQNQSAVNYRIMQQAIETNKSILQSLLVHAKENDIAQAGLSNSIHVIDYAIVPNHPVGPNRLRNVGLAFVVSLGLAIGWILVRENFDKTLRSIGDVEKTLRVPALAIVPPASANRKVLSSVRPLALLGNGNSPSHPELLLNSPNQVTAELYRQLLAVLRLSRDGSELRTLLVTSSLPGEGKTTTAVNTALSLAETGANVLLIDGDLRRPRLHDIFQVNNDHGLSNALSNGLAGADLLSLIKKPEVRGLSLLTSGPPQKTCARLFDHEKLARLLATLGSEFSHIVIDSPPIVPFADSVILGAEVDGVLLVVQGGKSPQDIVLRSMRVLDDVDAVVLGVVLNNTKPLSADTYYETYCKQYYQSADTHVADARSV